MKMTYFDTDIIKELVKPIPPIEDIISNDEVREALKSEDALHKMLHETLPERIPNKSWVVLEEQRRRKSNVESEEKK